MHAASSGDSQAQSRPLAKIWALPAAVRRHAMREYGCRSHTTPSATLSATDRELAVSADGDCPTATR